MKRESKLTPWFPADARPVREGLYEVRSINIAIRFHAGKFGDSMRYWDGAEWRKAKGGERTNFGALSWASDEWRGLASDPSKEPA